MQMRSPLILQVWKTSTWLQSLIGLPFLTMIEEMKYIAKTELSSLQVSSEKIEHCGYCIELQVSHN